MEIDVFNDSDLNSEEKSHEKYLTSKNTYSLMKYAFLLISLLIFCGVAFAAIAGTGCATLQDLGFNNTVADAT